MNEAVDDDEVGFYVVELPYPRPRFPIRVFSDWQEAAITWLLILLMGVPFVGFWIWLGLWLFKRLHIH